ncbi:MAG: hypothetical protein ACRC80_29865 [Waterburya sp.]
MIKKGDRTKPTESFKTPIFRNPTKDEIQYANCSEIQAYHPGWIKGKAVYCSFCNGWQDASWTEKCNLFETKNA